jgi:hypothetical protein
MNQSPTQSVPLVDLSFVDARARVIDVAAFLDRVQRHGMEGDYRVVELKKAIRELLTDDEGRAERVLLALSDPTTDPIPHATFQGAAGAWKRP